MQCSLAQYENEDGGGAHARGRGRVVIVIVISHFTGDISGPVANGLWSWTRSQRHRRDGRDYLRKNKSTSFIQM